MINIFSIDSAVADATRNRFHSFRALKRTAKFKTSLRDEMRKFNDEVVNMTENTNENINLSLTKNEALVLFEFLSRFSKSDSKLTIEDQAEERVLWNLCSDLEKVLVEPFQKDYRELLNQAREKVRDKNE